MVGIARIARHSRATLPPMWQLVQAVVGGVVAIGILVGAFGGVILLAEWATRND